MLADWIAFFQLEPPAADRADIRSQIHMYKVLNALQGGIDEDDIDDLNIEYGPDDDDDDGTTWDQDAADIAEARKMAGMVCGQFQ